MKRILLTILLLTAASASAQNTGIISGGQFTTVSEKSDISKDNIFSIRAGINISTTATNDNYFGGGGGEHSQKAGVGFSVQGVYERKLARYIPLYFQTGIGVTLRRSTFETSSSYDEYEGSKSTETITEDYSLWYLQIPLMVNYKIALSEKFAITPFFGINLEYGIGGKIKTNWKSSGAHQGTSESKDKAFDKNQFRRFNVGPALGVGCEWKKIYVGFAAQFGAMNLLSKEYLDNYKEDGRKDSKVSQNSYTLSVGYKF